MKPERNIAPYCKAAVLYYAEAEYYESGVLYYAVDKRNIIKPAFCIMPQSAGYYKHAVLYYAALNGIVWTRRVIIRRNTSPAS